MEKLDRSNGNDVSKLLDICRDCIVFESCAQRQVHLRHRVRRRGGDCRRQEPRRLPCSAASAYGYRDVNLVLRIETPQAQRLHLDLHLCELLLLLKESAELEHGHRGDVAFRNASGF